MILKNATGTAITPEEVTCGQGSWSRRIDDVAGVSEPDAWSLRGIIDHNLRP